MDIKLKNSNSSRRWYKIFFVISLVICTIFLGRLLKFDGVNVIYDAYSDEEYVDSNLHKEMTQQYFWEIQNRNDIIREQRSKMGGEVIDGYNEAKEYLKKLPIQYRIVYVRGGVKQTNILENEIDPFTESDYTYTYSINGGLSKGAKSSKTLSAEDIEFNAEGYRMLQILYPEDYMLTLQEDWHSMRREVKIAMLFILIMFFFIILWMVLIIRGSKERSSDVHTESLVLLLMGGAFVYVWMQAINHSLLCYPQEGFETISCIISYSSSVVSALVAAYVSLYSIPRLYLYIKQRECYKNSFFYQIKNNSHTRLTKVIRLIVGVFTGETFYKLDITVGEGIRIACLTSINVIVVLGILVGGMVDSRLLLISAVVLLGVINLFYIIGYYRTVKGYDELKGLISAIQQGEYTYRANEVKYVPYATLIESLCDVQSGIENSVEARIKSERLKVELLTNVSHDLKTPLTSIISYIDLLEKEEDLSVAAKEYIHILANKSDRLKSIVTDVFELAKTTSGEIVLHLEVLDLCKLVIQTLADIQDRIDSSGFVIKCNLPEDSVLIYSDGERMYRVLQNIMDNALKYSLVGSRIFVELYTEAEQVILTVKNTSNYEMDFEKDEIMERFFRGDRARTTEGSGLGLSIAKGFVEACGGTLEIDLEGDLFKVIISMKVHRDELEE